MNINFYTWDSETAVPADKTPITFISGFLGSGKTSLINKLLTQKGEKKIAVLVNDVGDINIDASLIKSSAEEAGVALKNVVELSSGCICCSMNSDLSEALFELILNYSPDLIIVESSGVAEPKNIADSLFITNSYGKSISSLLTVENMVTLIDPLYFLNKWESSREEKRRIHLLHSDRRQPLIELLIDQAEFADLIVLSKADLASPEQLERAELLIRSINSKADILPSRKGDINPAEILSACRYSHATDERSVWTRVLTAHELSESAHHGGHDHHHGEHAHHHSDYGLNTWLYQARKPFNPTEFQKLLRSDFPGVLRAKGFYWSSEDDKRAGFISIAGNILRMDYHGEWFITKMERGIRTRENLPEELEKVWDDQIGDRRQEIVFIGIDMDIELMRSKLDACLQ